MFAEEVTFTAAGPRRITWPCVACSPRNPIKRHIVTTQVEHSAVLMPCRELDKQGHDVTYLGVDGEGRLDLARPRSAIREETALVSVMWANNETGVVFPIEEIAQICRAKKTLLHVDAIQAVGKIPIDLRKIPIDLLSLSATRSTRRKGSALCTSEPESRILPILWGGHQERGKRPGTEPVAFIAGLARRPNSRANVSGPNDPRFEGCATAFRKVLVTTIPTLRLNGAQADRLPKHAQRLLCGVEGEAMLLLMDQNGIAASSGSACLADQLEPSHVLLAMGVGEADAMGAVRFSFSRYNTMEEVERVLRSSPLPQRKTAEARRTGRVPYLN